jgi:hypothetical protein
MSRLTLAPMEAWDTVHVFPMLEQMAADEQRPYPQQTPEDRKRALAARGAEQLSRRRPLQRPRHSDRVDQPQGREGPAGRHADARV